MIGQINRGKNTNFSIWANFVVLCYMHENVKQNEDITITFKPGNNTYPNNIHTGKRKRNIYELDDIDM